MRLREEQLVRHLIRNLAEGRTLDDDALTDAGMSVFRFGNMHEDTARKHALMRAQRTLQNPDVQARFADLFEIQGFSINDAVAAQIEFIRHGNYRALQDYFRMTQPQPPRTAVVAHVDGSAFTSREPRAIVARVLGTVREDRDETSTTIDHDAQEDDPDDPYRRSEGNGDGRLGHSE